MGMTTANLANLVTMSKYMSSSVDELASAVAVSRVSKAIQDKQLETDSTMAALDTQLAQQKKKAEDAAQAANEANKKVPTDVPKAANQWAGQPLNTDIGPQQTPGYNVAPGTTLTDPVTGKSTTYAQGKTVSTAEGAANDAENNADYSKKMAAYQKARDDAAKLSMQSASAMSDLQELQKKKEKMTLESNYNQSLNFLSSFAAQSPFLQTKALGDHSFAALFQTHNATVKAYQSMEMMNKKYDLSVAVAQSKAQEHYQKGATPEGAQAIASFTDFIAKNNLVATNDREQIVAAANATRSQLKTAKDRDIFQHEYDKYMTMGNAREVAAASNLTREEANKIGWGRLGIMKQQLDEALKTHDIAALTKLSDSIIKGKANPWLKNIGELDFAASADKLSQTVSDIENVSDESSLKKALIAQKYSSAQADAVIQGYRTVSKLSDASTYIKDLADVATMKRRIREIVVQ